MKPTVVILLVNPDPAIGIPEPRSPNCMTGRPVSGAGFERAVDS
jgi:hypothetical protein